MNIQFYRGFENALAQTHQQELPNPNLQSKDFCVGRNDYEGGEEDWLCSNELSRYISESDWDAVFSTQSDLRVLELGCGSARPSIALALKRAQLKSTTHLYLQELNESAAQYTIANAQQALEDHMSQGHITVTVFTSDWAKMAKTVVASQFHVILMAETLYKPIVFDDILGIITGLLRGDGICLSAQKKFYFGCGGGRLPFTDFIRRKGGDRVSETLVKESSDSPLWCISEIRIT